MRPRGTRGVVAVAVAVAGLLLAMGAAAGPGPRGWNQRAPRARVQGEKGEEGARNDGRSYRLEKDKIRPTDYEIWLKPDFPVGSVTSVVTFSGLVHIRGTFETNTNLMTLHVGNNLNIFQVKLLYASNNNSIPIQSTERDRDREFLHITLKSGTMINSAFILEIGYTATFPDQPQGFFKSGYRAAGEDRLLLATQFEPTHARKAFPCFDEPGFRATFRLGVFVPAGFGALSNTPLDEKASDLRNGEANFLMFQRTPRMPTYLLGLLVFHKDTFTSTDHGVISLSGVTFLSWARREAVEAGLADHSLSLSTRTLDALEAYTGVPYKHDNVTKVDHVAIPGLPVSTAEQWGLLAYSEPGMLVDPEGGSEAEKEAVADHLANEMAHQWFGNLVSADWWSHAWLSEGTDQLLERAAVARVQPQWRVAERFLSLEQQRAMTADARADALPLTHEVNKPEEIERHLGTLTHSKGAAVLRMLADFMGERNFQQGLQSFLKAKDHSSAEPNDLARSLEPFAPSNVTTLTTVQKFLTAWTETPGFPVVSVTRDYDKKTAQFSQERFLEGRGQAGGETYPVPLRTLQLTSAGRFTLLTADGADPLTGLADGWLLVNSSGYFRVSYDARNWQLLNQTLHEDRDQIAASERAQLVDDALALARAGRLSHAEALGLAAALRDDPDPVPWAAALAPLDYLGRALVADAAGHAAMQAFWLHVLGPSYERLGFRGGGSHLERLQRPQVLLRACDAGLVDCLSNAALELANFLSDGTLVDPDLRPVVFCSGVQESGQEEWSGLWKLLVDSDSAGDRVTFARGLACSEEAASLDTLLAHSLDAEGPLRQPAERAAVLAAVAARPKGLAPALTLLRQRFEDAQHAYGGLPAVQALVLEIAGHVSSSEHYQQLRQLVEAQPQLGVAGSAARDIAADAVQWVADNAQALTKALQDVTQPSSAVA